MFVVDTAPADESNWNIVATDRSAGDGSWSVTVPNADAKRYHAVAQFEESGTLKNALSKPFLTSQPFAQAGVVSVDFDVLSPAVSVGSAIPDSGLLQGRYDATELSLNDGDSVTTWTDETGNGNDLTEGTAPTFQTGVINGNPVVRFDGSNQFLNVLYNSSISTPIEVYAVFQLRTAGETNAYLYDGSTQNEKVFRQTGEGNWEVRISGDAAVGSPTDTNAHIMGGLYGDSEHVFRLDGAQDASVTTTGGTADGFTTGADGSDGNFAPVDFGEILVYDGSPTTADVESYLSDKWGIAI